MSRPATEPKLTIAYEVKIELLRQLFPQVFDALTACAPGGEFTGDDAIDLFALAIALVIDNDHFLTAPSHQREAAEVMKHHILRNIRTLKEVRGDGASLLSLILGVPGRLPGEPVN